MPVTRHDLLVAANNAAARLGIETITDRVLRDWIDEGLVQPAKAQGRSLGVNQQWLYPDDARLIVEKIMTLRSQGGRRVSQLAVCLWGFYPLSDFEFVKRSLQSEFVRLRKQLERQFPWEYDHRYELTLSEKERGKYERQLPPTDSDLAAAGFKLPTNVLLFAMSWIIWGDQNGKNAQRTISEALSEFLKLPSGTFVELFKLINIGGALGNPEETESTGEEILTRINADDLETARSLIWICFTGLVIGELFFSVFGIFPGNKIAIAYRKAADSVLTPDWVIASLGLCAIAAFHLRIINKPIK